jgi:hypothetical protein
MHEGILSEATGGVEEETECLRERNQEKAHLVSSYFRASHIPIGEGAEFKLLKYCKPDEITKLCVYQIDVGHHRILGDGQSPRCLSFRGVFLDLNH